MNKNISCMYFFKSFLIVKGSKGRLIINLNSLGLKCFFILENEILFIIDYEKKNRKERLTSSVKNSLKGVCFNFSKRLSLVGIGFRCWIVFENNKKFLIIKTSLSKDCILFVPKTLDVFCLNSTTIFITGVKKLEISSFVLLIKKIKKPNFYKQKGLFLENEIVKIKVGKKM
jgi:large subunit ribosomal protein L6